MKMPRKRKIGKSGAATVAAPSLMAALSLVVSLAGTSALAQGPRREEPALPPPFQRPQRIAPEKQAQVPGRTAPAPNPGQLLHHMLKANQAYTFVAREVTMSANGQETEQWVRWDPKLGLRRESIRPVNGNILIDNFRSSYVYSQRDRRWTEQNSLLPRPTGRIKDVIDTITSGQLKARWVGQDTVAGRTADIVLITPNGSEPAPTRRVWIDRATGVRLKSEYIGPAGRTLSSSYYLSIDLAPQIDAHDFEAPQIAAAPLVHKNDNIKFKTIEEATKAGYAVAQPAFLPTGFVLRQIDVNNNGRISARWGNGITIVSVIQMEKPYGRGVLTKLGPSQAGFIVGALGRRSYVWTNKATGASYAILGTIPDEDVIRIADSIR